MLRKIVKFTVNSFRHKAWRIRHVLWRTRFTTAKDLFLCLSSAILLILSFPSANLGFLAWFGFVPLFLALNNKSLTQAAVLFFITGVIFWSGVIYWLANVTLAGTIIVIFYLALYFAGFGLAIRPFTGRSKPYVLLFIPSLWVLLEYARSYLMTGFPWALLGYSQYKNPLVIQIADITGAYGVSFLVMLVNAAIVEIIWSIKAKFWPRLKITIILSAIFLLPVLCYGYFRLYPSSIVHHPLSIRVSIIQGNIPQELKWDKFSQTFIINKYFNLTSAAAKDNADLLIWPEAAMPVILEGEYSYFAQLEDFIKKTNKNLLLGAVTRRNEFFYNSALLFAKEGSLIKRYDKLHLVPFGEYIPLRGVFPFLEHIAPIGDISKGKEYTIFTIRSTLNAIRYNFAVLICFEDLFPDLSREFVKSGANFLVNITNDAWYKKTSASWQHLQASVFRAVENRVFVVRSANTGISGFINPLGRVVSMVRDQSENPIFVDGYKTEEINLENRAVSFYTRYGDIFVGLCALFAAICFLKNIIIALGY